EGERLPTALAAAVLTTDHCFVGFDVARKLIVAVNFGHVLAKLMRHAPRRLIMHAKLAFEFFRRNSMTRRGEEIHRVKPLLQGHTGSPERRSDHRVNMVPAIAGIGRHPRKLAKFANLAATLARDIFAISLLEKMCQTGVIVWELCKKLLDSDALCHVGYYGISSHIRQ